MPLTRGDFVRLCQPAGGYQPLAWALLPLAAGIACDRWQPIGAGVWWGFAVAALSTWLFAWRHGRLSGASVSLAAALFASGAAWHHCHWQLYRQDEVSLAADSAPAPACLRAVALGAPRRVPSEGYNPMQAVQRGDRSRLDVEVTALRDGENWRSAAGRCTLLVDGHLPPIGRGDELLAFGQLAEIPRPRNPGEFDLHAHRRADRVRCQLFAESPECVSRVTTAGWGPRRQLDAWRAAGQAALANRLSPEQSGLAQALLLGARQKMSQEDADAFLETGAVHLLSISGLHVAILAAALFGVMRLGWLSHKAALALVMSVTAMYALVIEAEPPAVRALLLVLLVCTAQWVGRTMHPTNALAATALAVLAWNPADLFRAGPQLSFMAVATMAWLRPRLQTGPTTDPLDRLIAATRPWHERWGKRSARSLAKGLIVGAAVWGVSLPLVMTQFHLCSPINLALTPLLALPVTIGLISGFAALAAEAFFPLLAPVCGLVCDRCLALLDAGIHVGAEAPGGHFWIPGPEPWWTIGFYAALALFCGWPALRPSRRWLAAGAMLWAAAGYGNALARDVGRTQVVCTVVSVGHGCSVLVETPGGKTILYDAGQLGSPRSAARSIASVLWSRGKTHVDALVLSHADLDHYNAVPELLQKFSFGAVYVTPLMRQDEGRSVRAMFDAVERSQTPIRELWAGDRLATGDGCLVDVLHPTRGRVLGSDNANSLVLAIEFGGRRLLLPGDLEGVGLDDLLAEQPLPCDVVMAPHHGSEHSDPPGFAEWSNPSWTVISGARERERQKAQQAYAARGATVLHTAEAGAVTFTFGPLGVTAATFLPGAGGEGPAR